MKEFTMDGWVTSNEPVTRSTATGKQVTSFSVNSPDRRKNQQGEWESVPQYFDCKYWHRSDRDFAAQAIASGAHLVLKGEPRYESWEKDGQKRSKVVMNVSRIWEIKGREDGQQRTYEAPQQQAMATVYDEDIPFD